MAFIDPMPPWKAFGMDWKPLQEGRDAEDFFEFYFLGKRNTRDKTFITIDRTARNPDRFTAMLYIDGEEITMSGHDVSLSEAKKTVRYWLEETAKLHSLLKGS